MLSNQSKPPGRKSRRTIAEEYGFSVKSLYRELKEKLPHLPARKLFTLSQQREIYEILGWPACVDRRWYQQNTV